MNIPYLRSSTLLISILLIYCILQLKTKGGLPKYFGLHTWGIDCIFQKVLRSFHWNIEWNKA